MEVLLGKLVVVDDHLFSSTGHYIKTDKRFGTIKQINMNNGREPFIIEFITDDGYTTTKSYNGNYITVIR